MEMFKSFPPTGVRDKTFIEKIQKQSKKIIWLAIAKAVALFLRDPSWLFEIVFRFGFLNLEAFTGISFCLLITETANALEPTQSNGLLV